MLELIIKLLRPDYYAQELLATISNLINNCTHQEDAGVCAILIDAMAFLCHSEVIDIESTFNALYPQFKAEKRFFSFLLFIVLTIRSNYILI